MCRNRAMKSAAVPVMVPSPGFSTIPRTPFCVSSGDGCLIDLSRALTHQNEQFARDVTLQAADCLQLGVALGDAFRHVGLGPRFRPQPADGDDVQGTVGCPVAASVEAMAGGLAR